MAIASVSRPDWRTHAEVRTLVVVAVGLAGIVATALTVWAVARIPTLVAPDSVLVAIFVGLGFWWGLPVLSAILLSGLIAVSFRLPLRAQAAAAPTPGGGSGIPTRSACSPASRSSTGPARPSTATGRSST